MDGKEFLERMARGDPKVFDDLFSFLRKLVLGACRDLRIYNEATRDDIVQDVCVKVLTHWESYHGESKLSTWIYSIARNRCLDELRKQQVRNAVSVEPAVDADGVPLEESAVASDQIFKARFDMEQHLCVQQVLDELDREPSARKGSRRKIDLLRWCVENSPSSEELAGYLQTTVAAAKERKRYLLQQLRELCQKFCGHDECCLSAAQ